MKRIQRAVIIDQSLLENCASTVKIKKANQYKL